MTNTKCPPISEAKNAIVIYQPNEAIRLDVRLQDDTIWLTQLKIAELFGVHRAAISKHLKNIFASGELVRTATVSKMEPAAVFSFPASRTYGSPTKAFSQNFASRNFLKYPLAR